MFRILVVDDQARIREGIRTILLKRQETMEIETAANGLEALSVLQRKKIHLVITDIRMPDMDGIALMESAARYYPDIPFVVVSGYDDFSYAQKAIEYGARAYLLKPLERAALLQAVDRIYGEYCAGRTKQEPELKDGIFTQLLPYLKGTGANPALVQKVKRDHSFLEQDYRVVLFGFPERELDMQEEGIRLRLSILLEREMDGVPHLLVKGERELVLLCGVWVKPEAWMGEIRRFFPGSAAVSGVYSGIGQLQTAYVQAREIGIHHFLFPGKDCLLPEDLLGLKSDFTVPYHEVERIGDLMGSCEDADIADYINRIFNRSVLCRYRIGYTLALCDTLYRSLRAIEAPLREAGMEAGLDMRKTNSPMEYFSMREYLLSLQEKMLRLHHLVYEYKKAYRENAELEKAIAYIRNNYHKQLTLAMVSNDVSLNYAYFSNVFRKYTGKTFMEYLRDIRMEEGKRLLSKTDQRIAQIAEKVGYDSYKSFSRAFKESVGITPAEYRRKKQIMKQEN